MKIQTVNQLISVFKDISTRHYQINGFGIGDNWENGASGAKMHPVLWINPTTATMPSTDNGYKTFEIDFEVRVFDLVNKDESNENEVLSDCIDILKDIITEFKGHPYYVNSQLNIIDDISFEAFTEEFDEEVSGWVCEISLMTPILTSFCGIPSADITGFEFPGVDCPDVNVLCPVFVEDVTGVYPIVVTTTGTTKEVSIVGGGLSDTFVISGEYDNGTLTLTRNDNVDVVVTGFASGGDNDYTTAATLSGNIITFDRTDTVGAYSVDLTTAINSAPDKFVESGAYDEINNKIVLTLNDASTVDIDTSAIGGGDSIYTADGTLTGNRAVDLDGNDLDISYSSSNSGQLKVTSTEARLRCKDSSDNTFNLLELNYNDSIFVVKRKFEVRGLNNTTSFRPIDIEANTTHRLFMNTLQTSLGTTSDNFDTNVNTTGIIRNGTLRLYASDTKTVLKSNTVILSSSNINNAIGSEDISLQGSTLIKGNGTSTGSALSIYDNDTTPNKLWDFLDNGNVNLGGDSTITGNRNSLLLKSTNTLLGYTDTSSNLVNYLNMNVNDFQVGANQEFEVINVNNTSQKPITVKPNTDYSLNIEPAYVSLGTASNDAILISSGSYGLIRNNTYRHRVNDTETYMGNKTIISPTYTESFIGSEDISLQGDTLLNANVNMPNLPTSATGLSSGDLWNDGGTLKIA